MMTQPKSALRQRVVTGLSLGALAIAGVLLLPTPVLGAAMGAVMLLGAREWAQLTGCRQAWSQGLYVAGVMAFSLGVAWLTLLAEQHWPLLIAMLWWLAIAFFNAVYRSAWKRFGWWRWPWRVAGFMVLGPAWVAVVMLHQLAALWLLFLLMLTSTADIAAFFAGRYFGHSPLAPDLSPGKTREGLYGALVACALLGTLGAWVAGLPLGIWTGFVGLCLLSVLISVEGDLFESLLKRHAGVKDSSALLPGHGGVLDRIDSVTAAAPVFVLGLVWILP